MVRLRHFILLCFLLAVALPCWGQQKKNETSSNATQKTKQKFKPSRLKAALLKKKTVNGFQKYYDDGGKALININIGNINIPPLPGFEFPDYPQNPDDWFTVAPYDEGSNPFSFSFPDLSSILDIMHQLIFNLDASYYTYAAQLSLDLAKLVMDVAKVFTSDPQYINMALQTISKLENALAVSDWEKIGGLLMELNQVELQIQPYWLQSVLSHLTAYLHMFQIMQSLSVTTTEIPTLPPWYWRFLKVHNSEVAPQTVVDAQAKAKSANVVKSSTKSNAAENLALKNAINSLSSAFIAKHKAALSPTLPMANKFRQINGTIENATTRLPLTKTPGTDKMVTTPANTGYPNTVAYSTTQKHSVSTTAAPVRTRIEVPDSPTDLAASGVNIVAV